MSMFQTMYCHLY